MAFASCGSRRSQKSDETIHARPRRGVVGAVRKTPAFWKYPEALYNDSICLLPAAEADAVQRRLDLLFRRSARVCFGIHYLLPSITAERFSFLVALKS